MGTRSLAGWPSARMLPISSKRTLSPSRAVRSSPKRAAARLWIDAGSWYPPNLMSSGIARRPAALVREALGREGVERDLRAAVQDQVGHGASHRRTEQDALATGAGRHVRALHTAHASEQEQAVRGQGPQARRLIRDLGVGHRRQHLDQRGADLVARGRRRLLVEPGLFL